MKIPTCPIHGDDCQWRKTVAARRKQRAWLMEAGVDPKQWADDGWKPEDCVEDEHRRVQTEIIRGVDWDEERWNKMHPGIPYRGIAVDAACDLGKKVWGERYVRDPVTGVEGPMFRNKAERVEYCRRTGQRALEPGEKLGGAPDFTVTAARDMAKSFIAFARQEGVRL